MHPAFQGGMEGSMAITKSEADQVGEILARESGVRKLKPVEVVEAHLDQILGMRSNGFSFSDIYKTISKEVDLGITEASFRQYVTIAKRAKKEKAL